MLTSDYAATTSWIGVVAWLHVMHTPLPPPYYGWGWLVGSLVPVGKLCLWKLGEGARYPSCVVGRGHLHC